MSTYEGWSNYETWAANLWLANVEGLYSSAMLMAADARTEAKESEDEIWTRDAAGLLAEKLENSLEEMMPDLGATLWSDLLRAAWGEIDWREIAVAWLADD